MASLESAANAGGSGQVRSDKDGQAMPHPPTMHATTQASNATSNSITSSSLHSTSLSPLPFPSFTITPVSSSSPSTLAIPSQHRPSQSSPSSPPSSTPATRRPIQSISAPITMMSSAPASASSSPPPAPTRTNSTVTFAEPVVPPKIKKQSSRNGMGAASGLPKIQTLPPPNQSRKLEQRNSISSLMSMSPTAMPPMNFMSGFRSTSSSSAPTVNSGSNNGNGSMASSSSTSSELKSSKRISPATSPTRHHSYYNRLAGGTIPTNMPATMPVSTPPSQAQGSLPTTFSRSNTATSNESNCTALSGGPLVASTSLPSHSGSMAHALDGTMVPMLAGGPSIGLRKSVSLGKSGNLTINNLAATNGTGSSISNSGRKGFTTRFKKLRKRQGSTSRETNVHGHHGLVTSGESDVEYVPVVTRKSEESLLAYMPGGTMPHFRQSSYTRASLPPAPKQQPTSSKSVLSPVNPDQMPAMPFSFGNMGVAPLSVMTRSTSSGGEFAPGSTTSATNSLSAKGSAIQSSRFKDLLKRNVTSPTSSVNSNPASGKGKGSKRQTAAVGDDDPLSAEDHMYEAFIPQRFNVARFTGNGRRKRKLAKRPSLMQQDLSLSVKAANPRSASLPHDRHLTGKEIFEEPDDIEYEDEEDDTEAGLLTGSMGSIERRERRSRRRTVRGPPISAALKKARAEQPDPNVLVAELIPLPKILTVCFNTQSGFSYTPMAPTKPECYGSKCFLFMPYPNIKGYRFYVFRVAGEYVEYAKLPPSKESSYRQYFREAAFIYQSLDKKAKAWKEACRKRMDRVSLRNRSGSVAYSTISLRKASESVEGMDGAGLQQQLHQTPQHQHVVHLGALHRNTRYNAHHGSVSVVDPTLSHTNSLPIPLPPPAPPSTPLQTMDAFLTESPQRYDVDNESNSNDNTSNARTLSMRETPPTHPFALSTTNPTISTDINTTNNRDISFANDQQQHAKFTPQTPQKLSPSASVALHQPSPQRKASLHQSQFLPQEYGPGWRQARRKERLRELQAIEQAEAAQMAREAKSVCYSLDVYLRDVITKGVEFERFERLSNIRTFNDNRESSVFDIANEDRSNSMSLEAPCLKLKEEFLNWINLSRPRRFPKHGVQERFDHYSIKQHAEGAYNIDGYALHPGSILGHGSGDARPMDSRGSESSLESSLSESTTAVPNNHTNGSHVSVANHQQHYYYNSNNSFHNEGYLTNNNDFNSHQRNTSSNYSDGSGIASGSTAVSPGGGVVSLTGTDALQMIGGVDMLIQILQTRISHQEFLSNQVRFKCEKTLGEIEENLSFLQELDDKAKDLVGMLARLLESQEVQQALQPVPVSSGTAGTSAGTMSTSMMSANGTTLSSYSSLPSATNAPNTVLPLTSMTASPTAATPPQLSSPVGHGGNLTGAKSANGSLGIMLGSATSSNGQQNGNSGHTSNSTHLVPPGRTLAETVEMRLKDVQERIVICTRIMGAARYNLNRLKYEIELEKRSVRLFRQYKIMIAVVLVAVVAILAGLYRRRVQVVGQAMAARDPLFDNGEDHAILMSPTSIIRRQLDLVLKPEQSSPTNLDLSTGTTIQNYVQQVLLAPAMVLVEPAAVAARDDASTLVKMETAVEDQGQDNLAENAKDQIDDKTQLLVLTDNTDSNKVSPAFEGHGLDVVKTLDDLAIETEVENATDEVVDEKEVSAAMEGSKDKELVMEEPTPIAKVELLIDDHNTPDDLPDATVSNESQLLEQQQPKKQDQHKDQPQQQEEQEQPLSNSLPLLPVFASPPSPTSNPRHCSAAVPIHDEH